MVIDSSHKTRVNPSPQSAASCVTLIEEHAAQLIDELFQDLMLEENSQTPAPQFSSQSLPAHGPTPKQPSSLALRIPSPEWEEGLTVPYVEMAATLESFYPPRAEDESLLHPPADGLASKIIFGITCLTFVGSVGLWIGTQLSPSSVRPVVAQAPLATASVSSANTAFAEDAHASLQATPPSPVSPSPTAVSGPSTVPTPQPLAVSVIPVSRPLAPVSPAPKAKPDTSSKVAEPAAKVALAAAPSINYSLSNRLPALSAAPLPVGTGLPSAATVSPISSVSHSGKANITIQGILELGDKSAMLIARNGSTQNVRIGEVLDSTGWTFLRVENGQAIIRRGSEIRAVSGGEQF